jgi:hypothetical protein
LNAAHAHGWTTNFQYSGKFSRVLHDNRPTRPALDFGFPRFAIERVGNASIDLNVVEGSVWMID